ncbi:serine/threonine-protein kinase [Rubrivirga marina]|uniref:Protein kinase domain-containing protein n=1 Tax=Rubrivirga marina TaxID=1196024 RepID=A0A271J2K8_9BACT|nr:serine/threonine-protein kinase [Rubrivirga marina]PAP77746.1 hypothetical protein BSZ37_15480 [Rubrivirga marina]
MQVSPDWTAVDAAFDRALDLDGEERDAYLATLNPAVRDALDPLLRDAARDFPLLDRPEEVVGSLVATDPVPAVAEGVRVGPYRIEELVGEGGMGRVYRAHRADGAFDKTVAVKVVRQSLALAGADVMARLRRERDLLATLDHPGIARLVDGGETDDGVPYLVTEFVDGLPITAYADAQDLGVRERVGLMAEVARAVDHAHRRFVVHRDLKPSNVLVAERDGPGGSPLPQPVVLDFGIAKLLDEAGEPGSGAFPLTRTGIRLLTPAYAAPELYEPMATVTTAADVYGLGALLYELLTGRRPHDDAVTPGPATTEPTWPSRLVGAPSTAARRRAALPGAARTSRALRGDLDTICLRALHPDPARRYASAADLAADLERHLAGQPVEARRDSHAYVVGRFVRRHRASALAVAVALVALVAGLGVSLSALTKERRARAAAEEASVRAREASDLLAGLFGTADPESTNGTVVSAQDVLDLGLERVEAIESPALRAYLLTILGRTYRDVGDISLADSLLTMAVDLAGQTTLSVQDRMLAHYELGRLYGVTQQYADAIPVFLAGVALASGNPNERDVLFDLTRDLSWCYREAGYTGGRPRYIDEAIVWAERAVAAAEAAGVPWMKERALNELASSLAAAGRTEEGLAAMRQVTALAEKTYGADHVRTATAIGQFGHLQWVNGEYEASIPTLKRSVEGHRRRLGTSHNRTASGYSFVARSYESAGLYRDAETYLDSSIAGFGPGSPLQVREYASLARVRNLQGDSDGAESAARTALRPAPVGVDSLWLADAYLEFGAALQQRGARRDAGPAYRRAVALYSSPSARGRADARAVARAWAGLRASGE